MGTPLPFPIKNGDKPCEFLFPWQSSASSLVSSPNTSQQQQQQQEYTDEDFARDMQGLSFQERQHIAEDVHLVADRVEETDEFVQTKIKEMVTILKGLTRKRFERDAWDKAVFLRPSLAVDQHHYLMCLRFKAYDPYDAATALLKFYETKHQLCDGNDVRLLCRRPMWDDLSEEDRVAHPRNGRQITYLARNREESCRRVAYFRLCLTAPDMNCMAYMRGCLYDFFTYIFANDEIQRKGQISVIDLRGPYKCTALQLLEINRILAPMMETFPCHSSVMHILLERNGMTSLARRMQSMYKRKMRLRVRLHVGSWMEIQYSLRSFGIDIASDWLEGDNAVDDDNPFSDAAVQAVTEELQNMEQIWRQKEAPYCDPSSKFALYPNPQDIIMGKKKSIVLSWPGNLAYHGCIRQLAASYGKARNNLERQMVVKEVLQRMKEDHQARFLARKEQEGWDALSDEEAVVKVSQSLRDEARKLVRK